MTAVHKQSINSVFQVFSCSLVFSPLIDGSAIFICIIDGSATCIHGNIIGNEIFDVKGLDDSCQIGMLWIFSLATAGRSTDRR